MRRTEGYATRLLRRAALSATLILLTACETRPGEDPDAMGGADVVSSDTSPAARLTEAFLTERDELDNVDSPAIWHGPDAQHWLLATAKETDRILAYDAATGRFIQGIGASGTGAGTFERPNGIGVIDDQMLVGPFDSGAFYAVHDDGNVAAFAWADIAAALDLPACPAPGSGS